jgi:CDGSH-type Zn-finger protein
MPGGLPEVARYNRRTRVAIAAHLDATDDELVQLGRNGAVGGRAVHLPDDVDDQRVVTVHEIGRASTAHRDIEVCQLSWVHRPIECRRHGATVCASSDNPDSTRPALSDRGGLIAAAVRGQKVRMSGSPSPTPVTITPYRDGPLIIRGDFQITDVDGRVVDTERATVALCRCGRSALKPFCDGSHRLIGFHAPSGDARR